jgi:hypothetical protein
MPPNALTTALGPCPGPRVLDYTTGQFTNAAATDSLFCSGHTITSTGQVVVVGGWLGGTCLAHNCRPGSEMQ